MGAYQDRLTKLDRHWKRNIQIPCGRDRGTPKSLRSRIQALRKSLDRPSADMRGWALDQLYAEWFERVAEITLRQKFPSEHASIRRGERVKYAGLFD